MKAPTIKPNGKAVLLVDDDPFTLALFRRQLEKAGFATQTSEDGAAAIEMLPKLTADLIILDLMLPKVHGFKVLEAIRADVRHKHTPVLILSNAYLPHMAQRAFKAGADRGMLKSDCTPSKLIEAVGDLIGTSGENPSLARILFKELWAANSPASEDTDESHDNSGEAGDAKNDLLKDWKSQLSSIRQHCLNYVKAVGSEERKGHMDNLYSGVRLLCARATLADCGSIARLSSSLEAMLFEHVFKGENEMSPSSIQTMVQAVDCLDSLFASGNTGADTHPEPYKVLLVDDDAICNLANESALRRAKFETRTTTSGEDALAILEQTDFDLILLDISMPGMDGFQVCEQLRRFPNHKHTPVIFVTLYGDFQNRAQSVLSGGNGLISKPITPIELIVKATVALLKDTTSEAKPKNATPAQPVPTALPSPATRAALPAPKIEPPAPVEEKPAIQEETEVNAVTRIEVEPAGISLSSGSSINQAQIDLRAKELQTAHSAIDGMIDSLSESMAAETKRRQEAEQLVAERGQRYAELEAELTEARKQLQAHQASVASEQSKLDTRTKELESARSAVELKVTALTETLAAESKRRELAESNVGESSALLSELETQLVEARKQLQTHQASVVTEQTKLDGRIQELESTRSVLEQKIASLTETLADESKRRKAAEQLADESSKDRSELNAQLAEAKEQLLAHQHNFTAEQSSLEARIHELERARATVQLKATALDEALATESKRREKAEHNVAESSARRSELEVELAEAKQQLEAHQASVVTEQSKLDSRIKEMESTRSVLEQKIASLTETLADESKRRKAAEQLADESGKDRSELNAQLAEAKKQVVALQRNLTAEQSALETRIQELEAARSTVDQKVTSLTETLAAETKLREQAEQDAAKSNLRRNALENELAEANKQLQSHQATVAAEHTRLDHRMQELESTRSVLEQKVASLTKALAAETKRREEAEQQTAASSKHGSSLEAALAEARQQLKAQKQAIENRDSTLAAQTSEIEATQQSLEQMVKSLTRGLAAETSHREAAEQQAAAATQRSDKLAAELSEVRQHLESLSGEESALRVRLKEMEGVRAALDEKVSSLGKALAAETTRREAAEKKVKEFADKRDSLEIALVESNQLRAQLQGEMTAIQQKLEDQERSYAAQESQLQARIKDLLANRDAIEQRAQLLSVDLAAERAKQESLAKDLASVAQQLTTANRQMELESLEQRKLAGMLAESKRVATDLTSQLETSQTLAATQADSLKKLNTQVELRQAEAKRLESLLQSETASSREEKLRAEGLEKQLAESARELTAKSDAEQQWRKRESDLKTTIRKHTDQLAESAAAAAVQSSELEKAKSNAAELQVLQSALCNRVQNLSAELDASSSRISELESHRVSAEHASRLRSQELAALRYAVLDATRIGAKFNEERGLADGQIISGLNRLLSVLHHTPLSNTQRDLITELSSTLDAWKTKQEKNIARPAVHIEMPRLVQSEFKCSELVEFAVAALGKRAAIAGKQLSAQVIGDAPATAVGNPEHIQHLVTQLTSSLWDIAGVEHVELKLIFAPGESTKSGMLIDLSLAAATSAEELSTRLKATAAAIGTLQTTQSTEAELSMAAAWQLALALGGSTSIKTATDHKVCVRVAVPLSPGTASPLPTEPRSEFIVSHNDVAIGGVRGESANANSRHHVLIPVDDAKE